MTVAAPTKPAPRSPVAADPEDGTATFGLSERPVWSRPRLLVLLPLGFFVALAVVFLTRLESGGDPGAVPSVLIGHPAPEFSLPMLDGMSTTGLARADLIGHVTLVNVFASWCVPCREEHGEMMALSQLFTEGPCTPTALA